MSTGAIRAGRAFVELFADNTKLQQGLRLAETQVKAFGSRVSEIGRQVATVNLVPAVGAGIGTKIFAGFDDQMRAVQAVTGSTGEQFDKLTEKAKFLGRTTSFTAAQVASGMLELGRAGFKSGEIDESIAHVMDLARATQTEIPRATEIAGNALRGFGLDTDQMGRVSDVLTTTANNSAQTLEDLGEAFKYVAPIASTAGMSLEDTAKVLGTLANFGIKGSMAGTAVKNILTRMADPAVQKTYESLGVSVKDAEGNLRNMADVLKDVGVATANRPNAEKLAIFKELFDMRAMAGGAKLSAESFQNLVDAIDNAAGESNRVAKTMDAGIGGAFRMCLSAAEGMAIAIGETLAPEIQKFTEYLTDSQTKITDWINENKETIVSVVLLSAKLLALGAGLYAVGKVASGIGAAIGIFRSSIVAARTVVAILTTDLTKIGKAFANLGSLFKPIEPINASLDAKSAGTVQTLGTSAQAASVSVSQLNTALVAMRGNVANVTQTVASLLTPLSQLLSLLRPLVTILGNSAKSAAAFAKALNPLSKTLQSTSVAAGNLAKSGAALGRSYGGMTTQITGNTAVLRENQTAAKLAAVSIRSLNTATVAATKGITASTKAVLTNTAALTPNAQAAELASNAHLKNAAATEAAATTLAQYTAAKTADAASASAAATAETAFGTSLAATSGVMTTVVAQTGALGTAQRALATLYTQGAQQIAAANGVTALTFRALGQTVAQSALALLAYAQAQRTAAANMIPMVALGQNYALSLGQGTTLMLANTQAANARTVALIGSARAEQLMLAMTQAGTVSLVGQGVAARGAAGALLLTSEAAAGTTTATTAAAGATGLLSKAMAFLCAHPVVAALTAICAVVAGLCIAFKDAGKYAAQLSDEMTKLAEKGNETRSLDQTKMEGIGKFAAKSRGGSLDDKEFAEGKRWVEELIGRYGDLGIEIDEVNKKILVAADSQKKFTDAMNAAALNQKDNVVKEEEKNLAELQKEYDTFYEHTQGFSGFADAKWHSVKQVFTLGMADSAEEAWTKQMDELNKKLDEQRKKLAAVRKERDLLANGDETIATGGSEAESVQNTVAGIDTPGAFNLNEFETKLGGTNTSPERDEINKLRSDYEQAVAQLQSQFDSAKTPEEQTAAQDRYNNLTALFDKKMAALVTALPESKTQENFWNKMTESGQSDEEKEIAQLNKDLTAVLEAIKAEIANGRMTSEEGEAKAQAATEATDKRVAETRQKYADERRQKLQETTIDPYDVAVDTATLNRDTKRAALETAKRSGDKGQIRKAQTEFDRADLDYQTAERNKNQNELDTSNTEMQTALTDYTNAGDDVEKRKDAKRRYDEAKSKRDSAQNYFAENDTEESRLNQNVRQTQTTLSEKQLALEEAKKTGDTAKIAVAKNDYETAQREANTAQRKQTLYTTNASASQAVETTSADLAQKQLTLEQAQLSGNPEMIDQAQSDYDEADYANKQAEYKQALAEAQKSDYAVSDAEQVLKDALKNGTPEEKKAAREKLEEAKLQRKEAMKNLSNFDTASAVKEASPDYSNPEQNSNQDNESKKETSSRGTFSAFESLAQANDWQKSNSDKQLDELGTIRKFLENRDEDRI